MPYKGNHAFRILYQDDLVRMFFSPDGSHWTKIPATAEVSGLRRNSMGTWCGMRPGIFAYGSGEAIVHNFRLKGLAA
jgi:beta-xylosidase